MTNPVDINWFQSHTGTEINIISKEVTQVDHYI